MEDEKIIDLFFARSEQAIGELDRKYGKACRSLAYRIAGSSEDAEECVNDAYLGLWNTIPPARPAPLFPYLIKTVRNISLNAYHQRRAAKRDSILTGALEEIEGCLADPGRVEDTLEAGELARTIEAFLDTLTAKERVIFMRRYAYLEPYAHIARRVGISEKNVSARLAQIRRKLRVYLQEKEVIS